MSWLDNYSTTNTFRSMYINGFIDISGGRLQTRSVTDGHLFIAGDTSLNGNLYVGGDISWNPNNLADNSIPSSAIIGGVVGATGPAGDNGFNANTDIMLLDATNHPNNSSYGLSQIDYKMSGSVDMLASPYTKRFNLTHGGKYYRGFSLLFRPGVYSLIVNFRIVTVSSMYFMFDLDNDRVFVDDPATLYDSNITSGQVLSFKRTYTVTHDSNFYFIERNNSTVHSYDRDYPQFKFERIGHIEPSGTDDTLDIPVGDQSTTLTDTKLIEGGIYWSSNTSNPPASGYEPSNHTSQGGTNEWAVVEQAANNSQQVLAWVHRINTNSTSSVEVASFHSDADLSLNKRLFVGEDVSLNGNLYVGGDISWNPTSLANNSIPSSAVVREIMLLDAVTAGTHINTTSTMYDLEWKIYGSVNFFGSTSAKRCLLYHTTLNRHYYCISINLKPGVYKVTLTAEMTEHLNWGFDNDHSGKFLWPNESGTEDGDWNIPDPTIVITTPVLSNTNFHLCLRDVGTFRSINNYDAQVLFERIGTVPNSSNQSDQALADIGSNNSGSSFANQETHTIKGGLYWSSTVTKPTDPDEYIDLNESGTEWIYRIS